MPLPCDQSTLPHTWLCRLGSTSEIPTGTAARMGYTYHPPMPTVLMVLVLVLPHILASEESNWVWRRQERESMGESGCGGLRAILGSVWIWRGGQRRGWGRRGKERQEDEFASSVGAGWLISERKIKERQKCSEKKMWPRKKRREKRWLAGNTGDQSDCGNRGRRWGDGKPWEDKRQVGRRWWLEGGNQMANRNNLYDHGGRALDKRSSSANMRLKAKK